MVFSATYFSVFVKSFGHLLVFFAKFSSLWSVHPADLSRHHVEKTIHAAVRVKYRTRSNRNENFNVGRGNGRREIVGNGNDADTVIAAEFYHLDGFGGMAVK